MGFNVVKPRSNRETIFTREINIYFVSLEYFVEKSVIIYAIKNGKVNILIAVSSF